MKVQTEQSKFDTDEHILVCLSSSPSNARIIHTAAKMAKVLHARFTAIYVQTDTVINDEDQSRLSQNIQLAQRLGAEIVMTHGENVALQISEYVRLSDVTKIVIGQSSARRRGLFGRPTLTEKLISSAPDVDIHIIPDALNYTCAGLFALVLEALLPIARDTAWFSFFGTYFVLIPVLLRGRINLRESNHSAPVSCATMIDESRSP